MMRFRLPVWVVAAAAFGVATAGEESVELPILGWWGIPYHLVTVERYAQARDAGFTHMMQWAPDVAGMRRVLDCAQRANVKLLAHLPFGTNPVAVVRAIKDHPALAMYHLRDEPLVKDLPAIGALARKVMAEDPKHPCYMNWCGWIDKEPMRWYGAPDYRSFIAESLKQVPIQMISFDKYPISLRRAKPPALPFRDLPGLSLNPNWYASLEVVRETSRATGKPFWAFALSVAHHIGEGVVYPAATEAGMKLQQYSNLAYGAQGLQYFTYWPPAPGDMEFHDAPFTPKGETTFVFDRLRRVNAELRARAFVFVGADARGVWHTGETIPFLTRRLAPGDLPDGVSSLTVEGGAVVSHLVNGGTSYLMVVNRELERTISLKVALAKGVVRIREDGSAQPAAAHASEYLLEPGEVEIFCLTPTRSEK